MGIYRSSWATGVGRSACVRLLHVGREVPPFAGSVSVPSDKHDPRLRSDGMAASPWQPIALVRPYVRELTGTGS